MPDYTDNFGFPGTGANALRGLGAGLMTGYEAWQQQQQLKRQQAQEEARNNLRLLIERESNASRERVADTTAGSRENVAGLQAQARLLGIQLTGDNQRDVANIRAAQQDRANQLADGWQRFSSAEATVQAATGRESGGATVILAASFR